MAKGPRPALLVRPGTQPWRLRGLSESVDLLEADVRDHAAVRGILRHWRPEIVFHCAMTGGHPRDDEMKLEMLSTSVAGTANLLESAMEIGVRRFIHLGSFLVYGRQDRALRESDPIRPSTFRGSAKAVAAVCLRQLSAALHWPAVELRVFSVYGPWEPDHRFIPTLLRAAATGAGMPLRSGPRHDFVHVDDVVDACLLAAESALDPGDVVNIGSGRLWTNEEVVEAALQATARPIAIDEGAYPPSPADDGYWLADIQAARDRLGWSPSRSLADGLKTTYDWMQSCSAS